MEDQLRLVRLSGKEIIVLTGLLRRKIGMLERRHERPEADERRRAAQVVPHGPRRDRDLDKIELHKALLAKLEGAAHADADA